MLWHRTIPKWRSLKIGRISIVSQLRSSRTWRLKRIDLVEFCLGPTLPLISEAVVEIVIPIFVQSRRLFGTFGDRYIYPDR
jgi:hypothetical protein